jgi:hypothetical protein
MDLGIKNITIFKKTLSGYYLTLANFAALRDIISLSKAQRTLHLVSRKGAKDAKIDLVIRTLTDFKVQEFGGYYTQLLTPVAFSSLPLIWKYSPGPLNGKIKPHLFLRDGVYSDLQTIQPPGYPIR